MPADDSETTDHFLSTRQAADLLGVSPAYLISLLETGEITSTIFGTRRRFRLGELQGYREKRSAMRRQVLADLTADAQDLGIYDA
jgi:excisionase family DNA binding protein